MSFSLYKVSNQATFSVVDGDTFHILDKNRSIIARLNGIDAPELSQPYGVAAKTWLQNNLFHPVIRQRTEDKFSRIVVEVVNGDGLALNLEIVRLGLAWVHPFYGKKYSDPDALLLAQNYAIKHKKGVHSNPDITPPWEHRSKREGKYTTIINRIHVLASEKGINSYQELASECNLTYATSYRYWTDQYAFPSRETLLRICNSLDVSISEVIELR